jgi:hypothetical protein
MPGPLMQKINARLQEEPWSYIQYAFFWIITLLFWVPVAIVVLFMRMIRQVASWCMGMTGVHDYDPSKHLETELAVFVTGCDSGFGHDVALEAAKAGYVVFAGCKDKNQSEELFRSVHLIKVIQLDVTKNEEVDNAVASVQEWICDDSKSKKRVLHALVNNAGIAGGGIIDWEELSSFQRIMDGELTSFCCCFTYDNCRCH